jgi:hypothetical protein
MSSSKFPSVFKRIDILNNRKGQDTIDSAARPTNVLDKKPGDVAGVSVESLVNDFVSCPLGVKTKDILEKKSTPNLAIKPKPEEIPLRKLLSAQVVQRPYSPKHVKKILENFDSKKAQFVNVLKIKRGNKLNYYITDGQHTAICHGILAKWGYYHSSKGISSDKWLDLKIECQVVEFDNFMFAREHFLGINGDDKKSLASFDIWKNCVLAKRQDSPNSITHDRYETAYAFQKIMESYDITPVHERDDENQNKPGAFTRVDLLKDLTVEEMHWWCQIHKWNWDDRAVDSVEVLPMVTLRRKIKGTTSLSNKTIKEFLHTLGNIIYNLEGSPGEFRRLAGDTYKHWYSMKYPKEKIPNTPADASLALLLQIYYQASGTFKNISKNFLDDYDDNGYTLFHALPQAKQTAILK